ncbi:hypothetical protein PWG15_11010 [Ensifer adhaerens]|uniref:hypothetical protein n=1 Tax=Ensifer adhaerens TaxID=106592 RepID=UPI0023A9611D|nr:hypothetical protein [Ensifer adhaerens]WDZ75153.1 hypothetical protein PWG15_11010 [Ensifer adhaerens]
MLVAFGAPAAEGAQSCPQVSYSAERARLQKLLAANAFSREESAFLLKGVDQRLRELPKVRLNAQGAECGIQAVRAFVLGCVNETLPDILTSLRTPSAKSGQAYWGKADVSRREAGAIGMIHACRAAAMETFFSGP